MEGTSGYTVFGATLLELMGSRGIMSWSELSRRLKEGGYKYSHKIISNWANGVNGVDRTFPNAVADVLNLTREEKIKLANAFTYGQDQPIKQRDRFLVNVAGGIAVAPFLWHDLIVHKLLRLPVDHVSDVAVGLGLFFS